MNRTGLETPFSTGHSWLHKTDTRVKFVLSVLYSVTLVALSNHVVLAAALLFSVALIFSIKPPLRAFIKRLLMVNTFILFLWFFLPWSVPGETIARIGPVSITAEGVRQAVQLTLKCNAIVIGLFALLGTSRLAQIARAMQRLHFPEKLVVIFFFCVRYINVIFNEFQRLCDAAAVRAFKSTTSLRAYKTHSQMFAELLVRSHDRSARIYEAMRCRGFNGSFPAVSRDRLRSSDLAAGLGVILVTICLGILEWRMKNS